MKTQRRNIRAFGMALLLAALGIAAGSGRARAQGYVLLPNNVAPSGYGYGYGVSPYGAWGGGFNDGWATGGGFYGGGFSTFGGGGFYDSGFYGGGNTPIAPTYQPYVRPRGGMGNSSFGVPQLNPQQFASPALPAIQPQYPRVMPGLAFPPQTSQSFSVPR